MEGKEVRFGIANSALWAAVDDGRVERLGELDARLRITPLGGLVPLWLMQLGEVVFGGAGSGLYGMLMFAIVAVFIAGLMVGRTPEYLGKKIEAYEVKMASLVLLLPCLVVLIGTAIASAIPAGTGSVANPGAHGFSEILYAFSSAGNNNGSAFGGLSANTPFYNIALGVAMWISRFWLMIPVLAIAGSLAAKRNVAITAGTLPTHTPLVHRDAHRRRADGRCADIPALARARPHRRALADDWQRLISWLPKQRLLIANRISSPRSGGGTGGAVPRPRQSTSPARFSARAIIDSFRKLDPRVQIRNPVMFVVFIGSIFTTIIGIGAAAGLIEGAGQPGLHPVDRGLVVVHGVVRKLRRSAGRGTRQSAGRDAAVDAQEHLCQEDHVRQSRPTTSRVEASTTASWRSGAGGDGRHRFPPTARSSKVSPR